MSKSSKSGFVIKLSNETVQKLTEEEEQAKKKADEAAAAKLPDSPESQNKEKLTVECGETSTAEKQVESRISVDKNIDKPEEGKVAASNDAATKVSATETNDGNKNKADTASWGDYAPYISYSGEEAIYTDPSNQEQYTWDIKAKAWTPREL